MKKIGFVDIHSQSPLAATHATESPVNDQSKIYIFGETDEGFTCQKILNYNTSPEQWQDVDEFYVSLPLSILDMRVLSFPFTDKEKIADVIPLELSNLVVNGQEKIIFDSIILTSGSDTATEVLAIYISTNLLSRILADLAQKNIDPRIVTSLDLRPPAEVNTESGRTDFLNSLSSRLNNPALWDHDSRSNAAAREIINPSLNLRKGSVAYTKDAEKTEKALKITVVLAFTLVFIFHAFFLFQTLKAKSDARAVAGQMRLAYNSLFPGEKKSINELYQLKSHIKESKETKELLSGVALLSLLRRLSDKMETNVVYTDISMEKGLIKMKAEAHSMDDLVKVQKNLSGFLTDVSISDIKPAVQGKVLFNVIARDQIR